VFALVLVGVICKKVIMELLADSNVKDPKLFFKDPGQALSRSGPETGFGSRLSKGILPT
jgi:hypothetical protein